MPTTPTEAQPGDAADLVLDREGTGQWVPGPDAHWQKVGVPFGDAKGFSRAALRAHIHDAYKQSGGGVPEHVHQFAEGLQNAFAFKKGGQYAADVKRMLREGGKEGTGIAKSGAVRLTDDAKEAGGEDAINAFRDRFGDKGEDHYWAVARERAGLGWQDALEQARNSNDPALQFAAAVHDNLPDAKGQKNVVTVNAGQLRVGQQFTHNGKVHRVIEDADGHHVLATDHAEFPLDALDRVPLDKGSLKKVRAPKLVPDDVAPFSNADDGGHWLHNPGVELSRSAPVADAPKEILGQPVMDLWADALVCGTYEHKAFNAKTRQFEPVTFTLSHKHLDESVRSFHRMRANGVRVPIVQDHQEKAASSLGEIVDAKRDGDRLMLRHRFVGADGIKMAARNHVSVKMLPKWRDSRGNDYVNAVTHSALTPIPVIPNQQGFSIAASRGQPATAHGSDTSSAPVLILTTDSQRSDAMAFTPEHLDRLRKLPGAKDVADQDAAEFLLSLAETAMENLVTLRDDNATLLSRADTAEARALELSRAAEGSNLPDDATLMLLSRAAESEWSHVAAAGYPKPLVDDLKALFRDSGKPNALALSRDHGGADPLEFMVTGLLAKHKPAVDGLLKQVTVPQDGVVLSRDAAKDEDGEDLKNKMIAMANGKGQKAIPMAKMCKGE